MCNKTPFLVFFFLCAIFSGGYIHAQSIGDQYIKYTTKEGLPECFIGNIKQDHYGYLWLATGCGLSRFDGYSFKTFINDPNDTASLQEKYIQDIFIDPQNRLWVISGHWIYLYHPENQAFDHFNFTKDRYVHICAGEGDDLIITSEQCVYKFNKTTKALAPLHKGALTAGVYYDYAKDEQGIEWIGSEDGLVKFDPRTNKEQLFTSKIDDKQSRSITSVYILPGDYLLAVTFKNNVLLVNRKTGSTAQFDITVPARKQAQKDPVKKQKNIIFCSYKMNDSIFALAINNGISFFNWKGRKVTSSDPIDENYSTEVDLNKTVLSIFRDREGIFWTGGDHSLKKYDYADRKVKILSKRDDIQSNQFSPFHDLYRRNDGNYFLLSSDQNYGLVNFNPSTMTMDKVGARISGTEELKNIIAIDTDRYMCNSDTAIFYFRLHNNQVTDVRRTNVKRFNSRYFSILQFMPLANGNVLLGTIQGLMVIDAAGKPIYFFDSINVSPPGIYRQFINTIYKDHNGCFWIGTSFGIYKIEKDGITVKKYFYKRQNKIIEYGRASNIVENKNGIIWFITPQHGVGRIDPVADSISFIGIKQGLPSNWYRDLCIDNDDNLWLQSRLGIVQLNTNTLLHQLYTEQEGFPEPDDITRVHYSKFSDKLCLLTRYAIFEIDTRKHTNSTLNPVTNFTGLSVFDVERPINENNTIHLNYKENFITIKFACLLFHNNKQIKYAYKMEGVDKGWVYCNNKREAAYTNLTPGKYVFLVKSQSPDGIWSKAPARLSIVVQPPFWRKWWFYTIIVLVGLAIIGWSVRSYTTKKLASQRAEFEKLKAVSDERVRIASDLHDDLGSGLTSIRLLGEVAHLKVGYNNPARFEIEKILSTVGNMSEGLREILWTMNTKFDRLEDFIIYTRSFSVQYFDNSKIKFEFSRPDVVPELMIPGQARRNIFLCIKEALHNIVKHAGATEASLAFTITNDTLIVTIKDNGKGIDTTQPNLFGNGLNSIRQRLNKLGSKLEAETNNGTCLVFKINISHKFMA